MRVGGMGHFTRWDLSLSPRPEEGAEKNLR